ncbi:MAG TPA: efflux RND transporter periplasmic adaptor subunit [Chthoniobacterales bacterium]|nr:efflux RND transporter periplasmic adaptor subunit [Chthoniobacterales bacterium]
MKHPNYTAAAFALLIGVVLGGLSSCGKKETATVAPPEVLVMEAATRDVPVYREWIGTIDGSENAEIRARVSGYLIKRDYQEGSLVKKGDLLFEIDPAQTQAALLEAKGQLEQARAVAKAAAAEQQRSDQLFAQKVISEQEHTNKVQLNQANQAKVKAAEANVKQAELNLGFCKVVSPVDGIAGLAKAQVGDLVGTGNNVTLTYVSTLDPVKVTFPISESDYLAAGQRVQETLSKPLDQRPESVELILADGSVFPHKAKLQAVDLQVKQSTGTILVTALLANPGDVLRPGFFARARIVAQTLKDAVVVPQRAVSEVQGSYQLGIIGADGKAEIRPVKVGARTGSDWVITSGLKAGEKVVVEGLQKIKAGAPVAAKPWTPPSETPADTALTAKTEEKNETKPHAK